MSKFVIFFKNKRIDEYIFSSQIFSIGRSVDNNVMLDDPAVSRKHAIVKLVGNEYILTDLGSENGTLLNNEPVITEVLKNNDQIEIGPYRLSCQIKVFDSILQHLSSQINQETGSTDTSITPKNYHIDRENKGIDNEIIDDDDIFMQRLNTYAFYLGIIIVIVGIIAGLYYYLN